MSLVKFNVSRGTPKYLINSEGILESGSDNLPGFEYNTDGTYKGLRVERQVTNLQTYSEDIGQWSTRIFSSSVSFDPTASIVLSNENAPDGKSKAYLVELNLDQNSNPSVLDSSLNQAQIFPPDSISPIPGTYYTYTFWTKAASSQYIDHEVNMRGGAAGGTLNIKLTENWKRNFIIEKSWDGSTSNTATQRTLGMSLRGSFTDPYFSASFYLWGFQIEPTNDYQSAEIGSNGGSVVLSSDLYGSSYIPTTDTISTRQADIIKLENGSVYIPEAGSITIKADFGDNYDLKVFGLSSSLSGSKDIKFQYSPTEIKLYVTGSLIQSKQGNFDFSGMNSIYIGSLKESSQFDGNIEYFAIE